MISDIFRSGNNGAHMQSAAASRLILRSYGSLPRKASLRNLMTRLEGGQFYSQSLRECLKKNHAIDVGDYSYGSLLDPDSCDRFTTIGRYVSIGPSVRRIGAAHPMGSASLHPFWYNSSFAFVKNSDVDRSSCEIGHDSWIGASAIILPGCTKIGVGAVIGAGTVVTRDVPDFAVVAGNPGQILRMRFDDVQTARIMSVAPWMSEPVEALAAIRDLDRDRACLD